MKVAPPSNCFAASRLQFGNGLHPAVTTAGDVGLSSSGAPYEEPPAAVTVTQIYLDHYSENHFYRTI